MARNGKSINVKIATTKVIKALETKLAQVKRTRKIRQTTRLASQRLTKSGLKMLPNLLSPLSQRQRIYLLISATMV